MSIIGQKFNRLTVIGEAPYKIFPSGRKRQVKAVCECGTTGEYVLAALKSGNTKSCGCYNKDLLTSHGMHDTRQYQIWADMKTRCDNVNHKWYPDYGGRGITYIESWALFENFWEDMQEGYDDNLTIDRINNDLGYYKENCRWSEPKYQSHNQRKAKNSKNRFLGVNTDSKYSTISARIKRDGVQVSLGSYLTEELAAKAYDDASEIIYGDRPNKTESCNDDILTNVKERLEGSLQGMKFTAKGSDFKHAVLTEDQVVEIYILAHKSELTQKEIGVKFGVNQSVVSAIKRRTSWAHATENISENI